MKKAFLFDMDGLLINSEPLWNRVELDVLNRHGVPVTMDDVMQMTGFPLSTMLQRTCELYPNHKADYKQIERQISEQAIRLILQEKPLMPGVKETLALLKDNGIKMAVASASPRVLLENIVESCGIARYFSYLSSAEELPFNKPHPIVYLHAAEQLGVKPEDCVGLEDSKIGMTAVKAASMCCIVIPIEYERNEPYWALADEKLNALGEINQALLERL